MNQEKIGKFIAKCRKERKLTQSELASELGVTEKSISNWENGRNMPDLSLFNPLCDELNITINELMSGEILKEENYQEKFEENIVNTINYTNKLISGKNNLIGIILIIVGILLAITAMSIFPSESSWGGIYSVLGTIISLIGISKFTKKLTYLKRLMYNTLYFIVFIGMLFIIDYLGVIYNEQPPRFSITKTAINNMIIYKTPLYNVYRINFDTKNEYYIIDTQKEYTMTTVPNVPFNRKKSGINNIIKYKNKYVGNNSNTGNLINNLPLSEYGYVFEIDSNNLILTIDYHITDWYIDDSNYLKKSLMYNSVSIFLLIDNIQGIKYNFSGNTYYITRNKIEKLYPNFSKINKNNFNKYVEESVTNDENIDKLFNNFFEQ